MTATPPPDQTRPPRRGPSRWTVLLTAVAVAAVLSPAAWFLTRPAPDAGVPLEQALARPAAVPTAEGSPAASSAPVPPTAPAEPPAASPYGEVGVRDASLDAVAREADPTPTRLVVDELGVDAVVDAVGVEDDGSMVVPAEIDRVGWYRYGPAAGADRGNAVIAGHVDAAGEGPGALFELREVEVGTVVTVVDETGAEHDYEVVGRETVVKDVLPVDDIFARDGEHRLVVVTCGGPFQPELGSYRDNVVVTAVPVDRA
ncbi:class F sortase [Jannaschia sp. R86511]|uniref:class F sortase n=1 Tax=Jannaschia sp. R86511 TaxID=3093853 RepID=UPI0036D2535A